MDFPAPFGPVSPYRRPAENVVVTSSKSTFDPNRIDTPVTEIIVSPVDPPGMWLGNPLLYTAAPRMSTLAVAVWLIGSILAQSGDAVVFRDDFNGKLAEGWTWIREDSAAWRVTASGLEIRVQPGNMWGPANDAKNVLVRGIPEPANGTVEIAVTVSNQPSNQYEQIDLVWYYDDRHMVKIGQEQVDGVLSLVMGREEGDKTKTIAIVPIDVHSLDVRFLASAGRIRGQFRAAGAAEWKDAGEATLPSNGGAPKASLQVYQGPAGVDRWARFNRFRVVRRMAPQDK